MGRSHVQNKSLDQLGSTTRWLRPLPPFGCWGREIQRRRCLQKADERTEPEFEGPLRCLYFKQQLFPQSIFFGLAIGNSVEQMWTGAQTPRNDIIQALHICLISRWTVDIIQRQEALYICLPIFALYIWWTVDRSGCAKLSNQPHLAFTFERKQTKVAPFQGINPALLFFILSARLNSFLG